MIVKREWHRRRHKYDGPIKYYVGWFLLGIIPLYVKVTDWRY